MPPIFWTGRLSFPVKTLMNLNGILAWIAGNTKDEAAMKERVKSAYDARFTDHVKQYDELGLPFQLKAAKAQLDGLDLRGKEILDVGAGTGAVSFLLLQQGARRVTCGDISEYMLNTCRRKAVDSGISENQMNFRLLDAESLPFADNSYDAVITGMSFGLFPRQQQVVNEMARVARQDGFVSVGAHGPEHYWEPMDAFVRSTNVRYLLGYRPEFWPRSEAQVRNMMVRAGLSNVKSRRVTWQNQFPSGGEAWDFFAAISSSMQYSKYPTERRREDYQRVRDYFNKKKKVQVTDDIILAYGQKK